MGSGLSDDELALLSEYARHLALVITPNLPPNDGWIGYGTDYVVAPITLFRSMLEDSRSRLKRHRKKGKNDREYEDHFGDALESKIKEAEMWLSQKDNSCQ